MLSLKDFNINKCIIHNQINQSLNYIMSILNNNLITKFGLLKALTLYLQMMKGYTTLKFFIGCVLLYFGLYTIYTLYFEWEESRGIKKVIYFLLLIIIFGIMKFVEIFSAMKKFVLGAGRYNQLRYIGESSIRNQNNQVDNYYRPPSKKQIQTNKNEPNIPFTKLKKSHTIQPADILQQSLGKKQKQRSLNYLHKHAVSMPVSPGNFYQLYQNNNSDYELKNKQNDMLKQLNKSNLHNLKLNESKQTSLLRLQRCRIILGNIMKRQVQRQNDNLETLKIRIKNLFNIQIIDEEQKFNLNTNNQKSFDKNQFRSRINLNRNSCLVSLDQVLQNYNKGILSKCGYPIAFQASDNYALKSQYFSHLEDAIKQRKNLDMYINFHSEFPNNSKRMQTINKMNQIAVSFLQDKPLYFQTQANYLKQSQSKQFIVWIVSRYINEIVKDKVNEATIILGQVPKQPLVKENRQKVYIKWVIDKKWQFPHYNQIVWKQGKDLIYHSLPARQNIPYLLFLYFHVVTTQGDIKSQLYKVPQLESLLFDAYNR